MELFMADIIKEGEKLPDLEMKVVVKDEIKDTKSSGKLVPKATMVTPTTCGVIPLSSAKAAALSMK